MYVKFNWTNVFHFCIVLYFIFHCCLSVNICAIFHCFSSDEDTKWLAWIEAKFKEIAGDDGEIDKEEFKRALGVRKVSLLCVSFCFVLFCMVYYVLFSLRRALSWMTKIVATQIHIFIYYSRMWLIIRCLFQYDFLERFFEHFT